jgi:hypothetical protein
MYGNSLDHDIKHELNGKLEDVCVALLQPRFDFDAHNLRKAIHVIPFFIESNFFSLNNYFFIY